MKKYELISFCIFLVLSIIYHFQTPDDIVETIEQEKTIVIHIEGVKNQTLTFDHNPSMKELFQELQITNSYGFDDNYVLSDQQRLYLPSQPIISLNYGTKEEFMQIKEIGEVKASSIIAYQQEHGFKTIEEIMNIKGIGEKTYERIREYLSL